MHHPIKSARKQSNEKVTHYMLGTGIYYRLTLYWKEDWITTTYEQEFSPEVLHLQIRTT